MSSKRRHEGYLLIDHANSPGVPLDVIRHAQQAGKWVPDQDMGEGKTYESATITCSHCHTVVILNPNRTRPRAYCAKCDHYVCDNPVCAIECNPFVKTLDLAMADAFKVISRKGVV